MVELAAGGSSGPLALEALEVLLSPIEAKLVLPLLKPDLADAERLDQLPPPASDAPTDVTGWLKDLVEDVDGHWRSNWLRACAIHAATARDVLDRIRPGRDPRARRPDHRRAIGGSGRSKLKRPVWTEAAFPYCGGGMKDHTKPLLRRSIVTDPEHEVVLALLEPDVDRPMARAVRGRVLIEAEADVAGHREPGRSETDHGHLLGR